MTAFVPADRALNSVTISVWAARGARVFLDFDGDDVFVVLLVEFRRGVRLASATILL